MAQMRPSHFPSSANEHMEDRENEVFELLEKNLPEKAVVLYEPSLFDKRKRQRKPDFVLFWQQTDCVVIEVKNWNPKRILHGDGHKVYLEAENGAKKSVRNPYVQAKDYQFALMDHLSRDAENNSAIINPVNGKLNFCVTPIVLMLNHKEEDLPELCKTMTGVRPEYIISEEALRDPKLLRGKLKNVPFAFRNELQNDVLIQAADLLCPAELSDQELDERACKKAVDILPSVTYGLPLAPEVESEIDMYIRLKEELRNVTSEARKLILSDTKEGSQYPKKLEGVMEALGRDDFRIGLFGVTAAGKSTFINALLGEQIMRPGNGETSKTITVLRGPTEGHSHGESLLKFKTYEELRDEVQEYLRETDFLDKKEPEQIDLYEASIRKDLTAWFAKQKGHASKAEQSARKYIQALLEGWDQFSPRLGTEESGDFERMDQALHDRKNGESMAVFVKERQIFHKNLFTEKQFVFYDSPGVGSSLTRHTRVAEETAYKVDAAILLTKVDYQFMPPDQEFVKNVIDSRRKTTSNLLCVLNQIGRIDPLNDGRPLEDFDQCVEEEADRLRERLSEENLGDLKIFPVDSKCAYYAKRALADNCTEEEAIQYRRSAMTGFIEPDGPDPQQNLEASLFPVLERDLFHHLTKVKYRSFASKRLSDLEDVCENFRRDIESEIHSMDQDIVDLNHKLVLHQENRKRVRRELKGFMKGEFSDEVEEVYADIESRIIELIDGVSKKAGQLYKENVNTKATRTASDFMRWLSEELQACLLERVRTFRNGYELKYEQLKSRVINYEIPDIIRQYGSEIQWTISVDDLDLEDAYPAVGLMKIKPSVWQQTKAYLLSRLSGKEKKYELLAEYVSKNFSAQLKIQLWIDLVKWIDDDREHCTSQVQQIFENMADMIEGRIKQQIDSLDLKESERANRNKQLLHYSKEIGTLLDQCGELRGQIDAARVGFSVNP